MIWFEGERDRSAYSQNRNGFTWPNTRCNGHITCVSWINQWDSEYEQDKHKWLRKQKHLNRQLSYSVYVLSRCINSAVTISLTWENTWQDKILDQMIWNMSKIPMQSKFYLTDTWTHVNLKYCDWTATTRVSWQVFIKIRMKLASTQSSPAFIHLWHCPLSLIKKLQSLSDHFWQIGMNETIIYML